MKIISSIIRLLPAALALLAAQHPFTAPGQALHDQTYRLPFTADSISLPGAQSYYVWQEPGQWELALYSTYRYLPTGQTDTNVNYYDPAGDPFNRVVYSYDELKRLTGLTVQKYDSGWTNNSYFEYSFDEHGNQAGQLNYIWFANNWQVTTGTRTTFTYDARSFITESKREIYNVLQYWNNDEWKEYIFNLGDTPAEILTSHWNLTEWVPLERIHSIDWKSYDGEHADGEFNSFVQDSYDGGWISDFRRNYTYGDFGSMEYIEQDFRGDTWVNDLKYEEIMNENFMPGELRYSRWENENWKQYDGYRYTYQVDGIDLVEIMLESWDTVTSAYVPGEKLVYSDFIHFLGMPGPENTLSDIKIFPNPSSGDIFIDPLRLEFTEISLYDGLGQLVLKVHVSACDMSRLDISNLPSGMYYLVLSKEGKRAGIKKVIKF